MQLSFTEANRRLWKNFFNVKGRASRSEYWQACLILHCIPFFIFFVIFILVGLVVFLDPAAQGRPLQAGLSQLGGLRGWFLLPVLTMVIVMIGMISLTMRRLHDVGTSGASVFLGFIPILNLWLIYQLICPSDPLNQYGPRPPEADDKTLKNSTLTLLTQFFRFSGRTSRSEFALGALGVYWIVILLGPLLLFLLAALGIFTLNPIPNQPVAIPLSFRLFNSYPTVISSIFLLFMFPLMARRLHDSGRSGWYASLLVIPLVGNILSLYWALQLSEGDNRFGPQPPETMEDKEATAGRDTTASKDFDF